MSKPTKNEMPVAAATTCSPPPIRVQLSRKKGWKMPPNTMSVARPHPMGNPHYVGFCPTCGITHTREEAIAEFEAMFTDNPFLVAMTELAIKGKNLACWCNLDEPCHADFLLRLANADVLARGESATAITPKP